MSVDARRPAWLVLASLAPETLLERARAFWSGRAPGEPFPWELLHGTRGVHAVVCRDAGSEGLDEELAEQLARGLDSPVHLLRLSEGAECAWRYEESRCDEETEEPAEVANRLGINLAPTLGPGRRR